MLRIAVSQMAWNGCATVRQAAGVRSGVVVTHSTHVLAKRAFLSKPLPTTANVGKHGASKCGPGGPKPEVLFGGVKNGNKVKN
jgi:hypothetical protein